MILKGEMLSGLSLRSRTRPGYPLLPLLFIIVLEIVDKAREINKREKKNCLYSQRIMVCIESPKKSTQKKLLQLISELNNFAKCINSQKSIVLIYTLAITNRKLKDKTFPLTIADIHLQPK